MKLFIEYLYIIYELKTGDYERISCFYSSYNYSEPSSIISSKLLHSKSKIVKFGRKKKKVNKVRGFLEMKVSKLVE